MIKINVSKLNIASIFVKLARKMLRDASAPTH